MTSFMTPYLLLRHTIGVACCVFALCTTLEANEQIEPYSVTWLTPSQKEQDSMPLGNGSIGVNAWLTSDGLLHFYIAHHDAWDEVGRLVKVGSMTIDTGVPIDQFPFLQKLDLRTGTLTASWGAPRGQRLSLRVWVDAQRPIITVDVEASIPTSLFIAPKVWRTESKILPAMPNSLALYAQKDYQYTPDIVNTDHADRIAVYHHNASTPIMSHLDHILGTGKQRPANPLLNRTFGYIVTADTVDVAAKDLFDLSVEDDADTDDAGDKQGKDPSSWLSDSTSKSESEPLGLKTMPRTRHTVTLAVTALSGEYIVAQQQTLAQEGFLLPPSAPMTWLTHTESQLEESLQFPAVARYAAHMAWWDAFFARSYIALSSTTRLQLEDHFVMPLTPNDPLRFGTEDSGQYPMAGRFARTALYGGALSDEAIVTSALQDDDHYTMDNAPLLYLGTPTIDMRLSVEDVLLRQPVINGITLETTFHLDAMPPWMVILTNTPKDSLSGLSIDCIAGKLRILFQGRVYYAKKALQEGAWTHLALRITPDGNLTLFINGRIEIDDRSESPFPDLPALLTRAYSLQRYLLACAGRGSLPIRPDGSLFTTAHASMPFGIDYRKFGASYPWREVHWSYYPMLASGDWDMMRPLFDFYTEHLSFYRWRTQRYMGFYGINVPENVYFWGDNTLDDYGPLPFDQRLNRHPRNKATSSDFTPQLELASLMIDYYRYSGDEAYFTSKLLPAIMGYLQFFDSRYPLDEDGLYRFEPMSALNTWWECVNPTPVVAGLRAVIAKLQELPPNTMTLEQRTLLLRIQHAVPPLAIGKGRHGRSVFLPASTYRLRRGRGNPALYPVFPFFLLKDEEMWETARETYRQRQSRGIACWQNDDICAIILGERRDVRRALATRLKRGTKHTSRFPGFWGTAMTGVPDQCHGSNLMLALQTLAFQQDVALPYGWKMSYKLAEPKELDEDRE